MRAKLLDNMTQVTVEEEGACRRMLHIEVPADKVSSVYKEALGQFSQHADIPGFRKGKAPTQLVGARFKERILEAVRDQIVPEAYQEAIDAQDFDVVAVAGVSEFEVLLNSPATFTVTVDVAPDFDLPEYKGIELETMPTDVDDAQVQDIITNMREQKANFEDSDDAVGEGDLVQIDYAGTCDGKPMSELDLKAATMAEGTDFWTRADDNAFLPEVGAALVGIKAGKEGTCESTFPEDFPDEALQGKTAKYSFTVKTVRSKKLPDLDDEFAKQYGVDTVKDLEARILEDLEKQVNQQSTAKLRNDVVRILAEQVDFELPESQVQEETRSEIYDVVSNYSKQGIGEDMIAEHKDEIFGQAGENAKGRLKAQYILNKVAKAESLEVTSEDIEQEIVQMAIQYQQSPDDIRATLEEKGNMDGIRQNLLMNKTVDFLLEHANKSGAAPAEKKTKATASKTQAKTASKAKTKAKASDKDDAPKAKASEAKASKAKDSKKKASAKDKPKKS